MKKKKKKKTNREEKPADVFLTDFCSHNIESRRVIVSSSERWKNIIIPILKDASDLAGLGLLGRVRPDGSLASILAPPSVSDLPRHRIPLVRSILVHLNSEYDDWREFIDATRRSLLPFYLSKQPASRYPTFQTEINNFLSNIKSLALLSSCPCKVNFEKSNEGETRSLSKYSIKWSKHIQNFNCTSRPEAFVSSSLVFFSSFRSLRQSFLLSPAYPYSLLPLRLRG